MKALVIGSGNSVKKSLLMARCSEADLIIAADGGGRYLYEAGLCPHVLVGDFDSIPQEILAFYQTQKQVAVKQYPPAKDYTDLELALMAAIEGGASEICILGAVGSRFDHTAANVFLLYSLMEKNIHAYLEDDHNRIYLTKGDFSIKKQENWKVSLLSISPEVTHLSTSGLAFRLNDDVLKFGSSRGVSNEFCEDTARITFSDGLLLVVLSHED